MITTCLPGSTVELINNWLGGRPSPNNFPPLGSRAKVLENNDGKFIVVQWVDGGKRQWSNRKRFKEVKPAPGFHRCIPKALWAKKKGAV